MMDGLRDMISSLASVVHRDYPSDNKSAYRRQQPLSSSTVLWGGAMLNESNKQRSHERGRRYMSVNKDYRHIQFRRGTSMERASRPLRTDQAKISNWRPTALP